MAPQRPNARTLSWLSLAGLVLCLVITSATQAQEQSELDQRAIIGKVVMMKGEVQAGTGGSSRYLDAGSVVREGDVVSSSQRSFAVLELQDGTRIALQSSSSLKLEDFDQKLGRESQVVELIRGGLRFVTGVIGRSKPEAVRVHSRNITIGIRGTTFAARVCNSSDCLFERGVGESGRVVENKPARGDERIFRVDPTTGRRAEISRLQFNELLENAYVALVEGAISVRTDLYAFELQIGSGANPEPPPVRPGEPLPPAQQPSTPAKPPAPKPPRNDKGSKGGKN